MTQIHPAAPSKLHWPSVWQLILSLFGILALWGISLAILLAVFGSALSGDLVSATALILNAAGTAFAGLLLIPSALYALLHLLDKPAPFQFRLSRPNWVILALPPILLLGYLAAKLPVTSLLFLPVLHVLAAAISVGWLLALGLKGISVGSPQRAWGIFGMGLVAAPFLSLVAELAALFSFGVLYLAINPELLDIFLGLSQSMPLQSPEALLEQLEPYLMQPSTLYIVLAFGALVVPLLEELFKPVGVWLLVGRNPTAAQGFAAGLLSGAGYALFENFSLGASAGEDWAMVLSARIGTSLIHILTTGLVGWALSLAWTEKRYLRLVFSYLVAVAIHAIWNATVIISAATELFGTAVSLPDLLYTLSAGAPVIFSVLILGCFMLLFGFNLALRRAIIPPAQPQPVVDVNFDKEPTNHGSDYQPD
jgi:hypothetical protein